MISDEEFLKVLEKRKDILSAEVIEGMKKNIGNISQETRQEVIDADRNADEVFSILDDFEKEIIDLHDEHEKAFQETKTRIEKDRKKAFQDYEQKEHQKEAEGAEQLLKNL